MAMSRYWWLVLNGKSAGDDAVREAVGRLRDEGLRIEVRLTWEAGDAERYVAEAIAAGADTVVAGGGDGTLSEVATTLARRGQPAASLPTLGLMPLGTANDFADAAGIPADPGEALRLVREAPAVPVDLLRVRADGREHWVANMATGGFGTEATTSTDESLKSVLGGLAYVVSGLGQLGRIEPVHARFSGPSLDHEGDFIALGIGNGMQAGGGQPLCPDACIDDGLIDLTVVPPLEGELAATLGTALVAGRDAALQRVALRARVPWLEITAVEAISLNFDGEPVRARAFRIECVPAAVRMHLPGDCPLLGKTATVGA